MSDDEPPRLDDLEQRLQSAGARPEQDDRETKTANQATSGVGAALRISIDLVVAIAVGTGIGWFLDGWLNTRPWLMLVFFVFGAAAGFRNVFRTAQKLDAASRQSPGLSQEKGNGE